MRMTFVKFTPYESVTLGCISGLADEVWTEIKDAMGTHKLPAKRKALDCLLLHLFDAEAVGVSRKQEAFYPEGATEEIRSRYFPTWYTPTIVKGVLDSLEDAGLIKQDLGRLYGYNHPVRQAKGIKGEATKVYATGTLGRALSAIHDRPLSDPTQRPRGKLKELIRVTVKDGSDRRLVTYSDTPKIKRNRKRLEGINEFLNSVVVTYQSGHGSHADPLGYPLGVIGIEGDNNDDGSISEFLHGNTQHHMSTETQEIANGTLDTPTKLHRRILCEYFMSIPQRVKRLGINRIYSFPLQTLSKEERSTIRIDGDDTVELDYDSTHPMLMYAEAGIQYRGDPYNAITATIKKTVGVEVFESIRPLVVSLEGENYEGDRKGGIMRKLVKGCFSMLLNNDSEQGAAAAWRKEKMDALGGENVGEWFNTHDMQTIIKKLGGLPVLLKAITDTHPKISHMLGKDKGVELMAKDADIALSVVTAMHGAGVPCLSIHDSFIVPASKESLLRGYMASAWSYHTGRKGLSCPVS